MVWQDMAKEGIFTAECSWGIIWNPGGSLDYRWDRASTFEELCFRLSEPRDIPEKNGWAAVVGIGSVSSGDSDEEVAIVSAAIDTFGEISYGVAGLLHEGWSDQYLSAEERPTSPVLTHVHFVEQPTLELDPAIWLRKVTDISKHQPTIPSSW
jgi:hypothetical protein